MTSSGPIWTLEARDSVMLAVMSSYFDLSPEAMRNEILAARQVTVEALAMKGVSYMELRNALVPQRQRYELALLFDTARIEDSWYGGEVADRVAPLLRPGLLCAIRSGDLIIDDQDLGFDLLSTHATPIRNAELSHTSQLYCVYINNLSQRMVNQITEGLEDYEPFIGYVDVSTSSPMKDWLSVTLVMSYLKARRIVLNGHEDDVPDSEDRNILGWPWEYHGYSCHSFRDMYFHLFLGYKIERRVVPGLEDDTQYALTAISGRPLALNELPVEVEEAKSNYLRQRHGASLERAGLRDMTATELSDLIKAKNSENYIYDLRYQDESDTSLFNIMLEVRHSESEIVTKLLAAIEYRPHEPALRLVTLY